MIASELKIRCSALGKIMTRPRSGKGLSETCKSYIQELFLELEFGIRKEIHSRYLRKGVECEKDSIRLANEVLGWSLDDFYIENGGQESFANDFLIGHTDVCTDWILADVKTSWSATSFPWFDDKVPKDYFYQLQGYMWLTGHDVSHLAYCLIETPDHILSDEIRREHWRNDPFWDGVEVPEIIEMVESKHKISHIPKDLRVKNFVIEKDEDTIEQFKERIFEVREYYQELQKEKKIYTQV